LSCNGATEEAHAMTRPTGSSRAPVVCDASDLPADVGTVDLLARRQLEARRAGLRLEVRGASAELRELLDLAGLHQLLDG
jgi:ABC-type transporter Mla MlaB component